jgi:hypothetical protein
MLLVAVAWIYVVLMIAVVEATSSQGTLIGAFVTVVLYGVFPVSILAYLFFSPARRRSKRAAEALASQTAADSSEAVDFEPDAGDHAPGIPVAPVRKEP